MKSSKLTLAGVPLLRSGVLLFLLLFLLPAAAYAEGDGYTMSLRASPETVAPGGTVRLAVQVHNDGWPGTADAEVAAFQAKLEYDRASLEYVDVEIPEGTMGDFSPESGMVLGYGEGHAFQENFDCAVLTMKVAEGACGEIPVALSGPVLARQDATELAVSPGGTLVLRVEGAASEESSAVTAEDGSSAGAASAAGDAGGEGAAGAAVPGPSGSRAAAAGSAGRQGSGGPEPSGTEPGTQAASLDNTEAAPSSQAAGQGSGETAGAAPPAAGSGQAAALAGETAASGPEEAPAGHRLLWVLPPAAAAAVLGGLWIWRRRRG